MSEQMNAMPTATDASSISSVPTPAVQLAAAAPVAAIPGNLMISRKPEEAVVIEHAGERIVVRVVRVRGKEVGLRVSAPMVAEIYREELGGPIRRRPRPIRQSPEAA